ncbi:MAG: MBL fold metallo-hydrolase [Candidatus Poseidoniaceae archaeon]|jgi:glyoxylase-like metal-dependent hydrolase (beta-lactamase superfamily II)|nr:MBL fold metallo-hydrolase [Candidatus Poseidoniaceae archaeon]
MVSAVFETEKILVLQEQLGEWDNLNHLIVCKITSKAIIVDPFDGDFWIQICQKNSWNLEQVWLTHSHWDHSKGIDKLQDREIWVHEKESERGWDGPSNKIWSHEEFTYVTQNIGELCFEIHCTPGHTPGHVTIIGEGIVVSGDCLFLGRCGRTDLVGGNPNLQRDSLIYLRERLRNISQNWLVLPGHQYQLSDGTNPTSIIVKEILSNNEALQALDDDSAWNKLDFLAFEDSLSENAKRHRAMNS